MQKLLCLLSAILIFISPSYARDLRFVQVTDVMFHSSDENNNLEKVVNDINKQSNIEFVIFTGDNISKPDKQELNTFLSTAKKLKRPFYVVIGDRDVNKRKGWSKKDYAKYVHKKVLRHKPSTPNYVFEKKDIVFIVADGAKDVITSRNGFFKDDVLEWLDANLDMYSKKPVIIFQHFPVIPPSNKESYYTYQPEKYLEIVSKHKNVKAIISGHFGVNKEQEINGITHISTAPAPNYRVIDIIDYDTNTPTIWAEVHTAK